jgi:hypothetical protein
VRKAFSSWGCEDPCRVRNSCGAAGSGVRNARNCIEKNTEQLSGRFAEQENCRRRFKMSSTVGWVQHASIQDMLWGWSCGLAQPRNQAKPVCGGRRLMGRLAPVWNLQSPGSRPSWPICHLPDGTAVLGACNIPPTDLVCLGFPLFHPIVYQFAEPRLHLFHNLSLYFSFRPNLFLGTQTPPPCPSPRRRCPRSNARLGAQPALRRFPQQTVNRKPSPCEARTLQLLIVFQPASAESPQRTTTTPS